MWKILIDPKELEEMEGIISDDTINDIKVYYEYLKENMYRATLPAITVFYRNLETNELSYRVKALSIKSEEEVKDYETKDGFCSIIGVWLHEGNVTIRCDEFPILLEDSSSLISIPR